MFGLPSIGRFEHLKYDLLVTFKTLGWLTWWLLEGFNVQALTRIGNLQKQSIFYMLAPTFMGAIV